MARRGVVERIARYEVKLDADRIKQDIERLKPAMVAKQADRISRLVSMEDQVKGLLGGEDVPTVQYVWFHDFTRQVFALQENFGGGNGLVREVRLLVHEWSSRGADEAVLKKLAFEVFSIKLDRP